MKKIAYLFLLAVLLFAVLCGCDKGNGEGTPSDNPDDDTLLNVNVDILKIGKADCIIINTGSRILMIDTGEEENLDQINYFMYMNEYEKIDTLILTHYDKDHIGGAAEIIKKYQVSSVIEPSIVSINEWYIKYHNVLDEMGITPIKLSQDYRFEYDGCQIDIKAPKRNMYSEKQDNNSSLVVSMECNQKRLLFCADAMELRISELISEDLGEYDFFKLPYHGNYIENYRAFLNMVMPKYGAITCSNKNPPNDQTLSILDEYGVDTYQTRYGDIHIFTDGKTISVGQ